MYIPTRTIDTTTGMGFDLIIIIIIIINIINIILMYFIYYWYMLIFGQLSSVVVPVHSTYSSIQ